MNVEESSVLEKVRRPTEGARHITLIDPAKQSPDIAAQRAMLAVECGSKMVFEARPIRPMTSFVRRARPSKRRLNCECSPRATSDGQRSRLGRSRGSLPGGAHALSPAADAITFMMLMNSTKREFLVGEQVRGAPYLAKFGVEALPTGYVVCAYGRVGEVVVPN